MTTHFALFVQLVHLGSKDFGAVCNRFFRRRLKPRFFGRFCFFKFAEIHHFKFELHLASDFLKVSDAVDIFIVFQKCAIFIRTCRRRNKVVCVFDFRIDNMARVILVHFLAHILDVVFSRHGIFVAATARRVRRNGKLAAAGADIIMLDNMSHDVMKEAMGIIAGKAEVEVSGNVTKENIARITDLGVDYISSGALTHSAPILDLSLKNLHAV